MRCTRRLFRRRVIMVELSKERVEQILHEETVGKEELTTILRGIYTRYMRLYERYFADIDALNDDVIAELRAYHEETRSLEKYYYMDIPMDVCLGLKAFNNEYSSKLLGPEWHDYVFNYYEDYKKGKKKSEEYLKAEFTKEIMSAFYDTMDYIFRDDFGTDSHTAKDVVKKITGLLFSKD